MIINWDKWDISDDSLIVEKDKLNANFLKSFYNEAKNLIIKRKIIVSGNSGKHEIIALPIKEWNMDACHVKRIRIPEYVKIENILTIYGIIREDELDVGNKMILHDIDFEYKNRRQIDVKLTIKKNRKYDYIILTREQSGFFDNCNFDNCKINRGLLNITVYNKK